MKISIRNNVFETNSSSTHSFTICTNEGLKERQKKYLKQQERLQELSRLNSEDKLTDEEKNELFELEFFNTDNYATSFQIKSPLAKLVWLKGLMDNACENPISSSYEYVSDFYLLLKQEYCKIENLTNEEANKKILEEGCKFVEFENILKDESESQKESIQHLLKFNHNFKQFASKYKNKVQALKDYANNMMLKECASCNGKLSCDHYFSEGVLDECYCGFDCFSSIEYELNKIRKDKPYEEFAKEFISDKYIVIGIENWNNCCILNSDRIY